MATEAAPVNGLYGNSQYTQPAELAASTPSAPAHAASASQSGASVAAQKADPQEIGWYFVEQYYTTLSKSPEKIHLFYSKKSQLVTGIEADKVVPAVGSKAISEKIKALEFQDCKVRVLNVDSQSSFNNIVVQVIGEMSNKSEPHHKFVQTFVLAEQPNGYFVLNDIFRYLKDEEDEIVDDEQPQTEIPAEQPPTPAEGLVDTEATSDETVTTEPAVEEVDGKLEEEKASAMDEPENTEVNGALVPSTAEPSVAAPESSASTEEVEADETSAPAAEQPDEPETTPANTAPTDSATPPAVEAPLAKKTWASMLGGGGVKAPAVPALPVTAPANQSKAPRPSQPTQTTKAPVESASAPTNTASSTPTSQSNGWQTAGDSKKGKGPQSKPTEGVVLAYIKNVNDKVDARTLREVLESFGELKYFDVSRPRNCAFVEFADSAGYTAAVAANPHTVGTEQIYVEERRPRPNAYGGSNVAFSSRGNGNAGRGGGRGNFQGPRSNSQTNFPKDAGRGTFPPRGAKSGRGQTTPTA